MAHLTGNDGAKQQNRVNLGQQQCRWRMSGRDQLKHHGSRRGRTNRARQGQRHAPNRAPMLRMTHVDDPAARRIDAAPKTDGGREHQKWAGALAFYKNLASY